MPDRFWLASFITIVGLATLVMEPDTALLYDEPVAAPPSSVPVIATPAQVSTTATRGAQVQVVETIASTTSTTTPPQPAWTPGDCESFRPLLSHAAGTALIDGGILQRESGCGLDLLNERTGDSSFCQINPVHNRPGWFGGREFGEGGWLYALHGLTTRTDLENLEWLAACETLFAVCGTGPWSPPYSCDNRPL